MDLNMKPNKSLLIAALVLGGFYFYSRARQPGTGANAAGARLPITPMRPLLVTRSASQQAANQGAAGAIAPFANFMASLLGRGAGGTQTPTAQAGGGFSYSGPDSVIGGMPPAFNADNNTVTAYGQPGAWGTDDWSASPVTNSMAPTDLMNWNG